MPGAKSLLPSIGKGQDGVTDISGQAVRRYSPGLALRAHYAWERDTDALRQRAGTAHSENICQAACRSTYRQTQFKCVFPRPELLTITSASSQLRLLTPVSRRQSNQSQYHPRQEYHHPAVHEGVRCGSEVHDDAREEWRERAKEGCAVYQRHNR